MRATVVVPRLEYDGTIYEKGDSIRLTKEEGERFAAHGWIDRESDEDSDDDESQEDN